MVKELKSVIKEQFPQLAEDPDLLKEFDKTIITRSFKKSTVIVDYGDHIKYIPLVLDGVLKVLRENEDGKEVLLYFLERGQTCAASFSCCLTKKRSEIKLIADTNCRVALIPLAKANNWMKKYDAWRDYVFNAFEARLFAMIDTVDRLAFTNLDQQLLEYLESRSVQIADHTIRMSHAEIARDLSASREAISRLLKKLEDQKKVKLGRNKITLEH